MGNPVLFIKDDQGNKVPVTALVGPHFEPHVSAGGDLSWTNNGGMTNPPTVNVKGRDGLTTKVKVNGQTFEQQDGTVDIGTVLREHQDISGKQDVISDLSAIRSGAALGATALQTTLPKIVFPSSTKTATLTGFPIENGRICCVVFSYDAGGTGDAGSVTLNNQLFYVRWLSPSGSIINPPTGAFKAGRAYIFRLRHTESDNRWYLLTDTVFGANSFAVPVANGGTGATTAAAARENLGIPATTTNKGKYLHVNALTGAIEWTSVPNELEALSEADDSVKISAAAAVICAGKLPFVRPGTNSGEWLYLMDAEISEGLSDYVRFGRISADDDGRVYYSETLLCYDENQEEIAVSRTMRLKPAIATALPSAGQAVSPGTQYYLGAQSAVSVVLPQQAEAGDLITCVFYSGATAATLSVTGAFLGELIVPKANERIELNMLYDGENWAIVSGRMAVTV